MRAFILLILLSTLTSCCRPPPNDTTWVKKTVQERLQQEICLSECQTTKTAVDDFVCHLLHEPLSIQSATQIALLHSPMLKAEFENIGIAYSDLIEAGLFTNPVFSASVRYPDKKFLVTNWSVGIAATFLDLLTVPLRKRVAAIEYEQTKIDVTFKVLILAHQVFEICIELQTIQTNFLHIENIYEMERLTFQIAQDQYQARNISLYMLNQFCQRVQDAYLTVQQAELDRVHFREELNRLLGLSGKETCWTLEPNLSDLPHQEPSLDCLESIACANRLDLQTAYLEMIKLTKAMKTKAWWTYTDLQIDVSREQESEDFIVTGPGIAMALPIFNTGQADRARLSALLKQSQQNYFDLKVHILADVREMRQALEKRRQMVEYYYHSINPSLENLMQEAQTQYNVMAIGVYQLLDIKKQQWHAEMNITKALRDYWIAWEDLNSSVGDVLCAPQ